MTKHGHRNRSAATAALARMVGAMLAAGAAWGAPEKELSAAELKEAKRLYVAKCAKCHEFYAPAAYPVAEWKVWMDKMGKKSKLTTEQTDLLKRYTEILRAAGKAKP
jgi:nitrate/TMAO reductase-like tetraheme cytochrome c subunit